MARVLGICGGACREVGRTDWLRVCLGVAGDHHNQGITDRRLSVRGGGSGVFARPIGPTPNKDLASAHWRWNAVGVARGVRVCGWEVLRCEAIEWLGRVGRMASGRGGGHLKAGRVGAGQTGAGQTGAGRGWMGWG